MDRIYLDYAATTPVNREAINAMAPYFDLDFGNPSSAHYFGQRAEAAVETARTSILSQLNGVNYEVIFTSGGTEGDNLALRGAGYAARDKRGSNQIFTSCVEHDAILATAQQMSKKHGFIHTKLRVDKYGFLDLDHLEKTINQNTAIVSVIYGNNEIGTINSINEITQICHNRGVLFHTDAVQVAAHQRINLDLLDVDLMTISAHKFYGPKGVGALIKKKNIKLEPHVTGGKQEGMLRAGTQNVSAIVGMAKALEIRYQKFDTENLRLLGIRDKLIQGVLNTIPESFLTGHPKERLSNHASFVFSGINGNDLLIACDMAGFAVSSGSACKVGLPTPSEVLLAIGIESTLAMGSLRITLGRNEQ